MVLHHRTRLRKISCDCVPSIYDLQKCRFNAFTRSLSCSATRLPARACSRSLKQYEKYVSGEMTKWSGRMRTVVICSIFVYSKLIFVWISIILIHGKCIAAHVYTYTYTIKVGNERRTYIGSVLHSKSFASLMLLLLLLLLHFQHILHFILLCVCVCV